MNVKAGGYRALSFNCFIAGCNGPNLDRNQICVTCSLVDSVISRNFGFGRLAVLGAACHHDCYWLDPKEQSSDMYVCLCFGKGYLGIRYPPWKRPVTSRLVHGLLCPRTPVSNGAHCLGPVTGNRSCHGLKVGSKR